MLSINNEIILTIGAKQLYEILTAFSEEMASSISQDSPETIFIDSGSILSLNPNTVPFEFIIKNVPSQNPPAENQEYKFTVTIEARPLPWMIPRYKKILEYRYNQLLNFLWEKKVLKQPADFPKGPVLKNPFFLGVSLLPRMPDFAFNLLYSILAFFLTILGAMLAMWILGMILYSFLLNDIQNTGRILDFNLNASKGSHGWMNSFEYYAAVGVFFGIFGGIFTGVMAFLINYLVSISNTPSRYTLIFEIIICFMLFVVLVLDIPFLASIIVSALFVVFTYIFFSLTWGLKKDLLRY